MKPRRLRPPAPAFDVVNAYTSDYAGRGVCATTDGQSHPTGRSGVFHGAGSLQSALCAEHRVDARAAGGRFGGCVRSVGVLVVLAGSFEPYRTRTRLFRTMNDVFLAINQRPQLYLDQSPFGVLDLSGRATGGAFGRPRKVTRLSRTARQWNSVSASVAVPDLGGLSVRRSDPREPPRVKHHGLSMLLVCGRRESDDRRRSQQGYCA